jgi:hypothetical protein
VLRQVVKRNPFVYRHAIALREAQRHARRWAHSERLSNAAKHQLIRDTAVGHDLRVLVETGTYEGETAYWLRKDFDAVYTIELEPSLHRLAAARLAPYPHVHVLFGDGPSVLPSVLDELDHAALFWLDSHGSTTKTAGGGSPALRELELVLSHPEPHVALIDDVRLLGSPGWPTVDDLSACAERYGRTLSVDADIARVLA